MKNTKKEICSSPHVVGLETMLVINISKLLFLVNIVAATYMVLDFLDFKTSFATQIFVLKISAYIDRRDIFSYLYDKVHIF